jgi:hypothetical protein
VSTGDFQVNFSSDKAVELYLRKGISQDLPDGVTYDMRITNETRATIASNLMNFEQGAILAVHCMGEESDTTTYKL